MTTRRPAAPLSDAQWTSLARDARRVLDRAAPEWTDSNASDPGITLVTLFAFLTDVLLYRSGLLSEPARCLARDVAQRAAALASVLEPTAHDGGEAGGLRRVSFFTGQLLSADDLQTEQRYLLDRLARRNRLLDGAGIVDGLGVTIEAGNDPLTPRVVVAPGLAFDPFGREIAVDAPWSAPLPASGDALLVQLGYRERACREVPASASNGSGADAAAQPTRVVEGFAATLAPAPISDTIGIARVVRTRGRWRVDPKFAPPRVRR